MNGWMDGLMGEWMNGWMDEYIIELTEKWMDWSRKTDGVRQKAIKYAEDAMRLKGRPAARQTQREEKQGR